MLLSTVRLHTYALVPVRFTVRNCYFFQFVFFFFRVVRPAKKGISYELCVCATILPAIDKFRVAQQTICYRQAVLKAQKQFNLSVVLLGHVHLSHFEKKTTKMRSKKKQKESHDGALWMPKQISSANKLFSDEVMYIYGHVRSHIYSSTRKSENKRTRYHGKSIRWFINGRTSTA